MEHAMDILRERRFELQKLIRTCKENQDRIMQGISTTEYEKQLADIDHSLQVLYRGPKLHP